MEKIKVEEAINVIEKNYIESDLGKFFSNKIIDTLTDPSCKEKNKKFSFILSIDEFQKGIERESKTFIILAFKKMMKRMYHNKYSFPFTVLEKSLFQFDIIFEKEEFEEINKIISTNLSPLKRQIVLDLQNIESFKRNLRNGILPTPFYFVKMLSNNPIIDFDKDVACKFSFEYVNFRHYITVLHDIIEESFPELMTKPLRNTFSQIFHL